MEENYVSKGQVLAWLAWAIAAGLLFSAWAVILLLDVGEHVAGMLAASASLMAAFAVALQVRTYFVRMAGLIRSRDGCDRRMQATR